MRAAILKLSVCGLAGLAISMAIVSLRGPALYRSKAVLRLTHGDLPADIEPAQPRASSLLISSMAQNAMSRSSLTNLINTYGLYRDERATRPMMDVVEDMRSRITISSDDNETAEVAFQYSDPQLAQKVTQDLAANIAREAVRGRINLSYFNEQFFRDMTSIAARDWDSQAAVVRAAGHSATAKMKLDLELARQRYLSLQEKLGSAKRLRTLDERQMGPRLEVLEAASYNVTPQRANAPILAGGVLCGLIAGVLLALRKFPSFQALRPLGGFTRRGVLTVLAYGIAGFLIAGVVAMIVTKNRTYSSTAVIRVVPTTMPLLLVEGNTPEQWTALLQEITQMTLSRGNLVNLINSNGLYSGSNEAGIEERVERIRRDITFAAYKSFGVQVEFRYPAPWLAQRVAQHLVSRMVNGVHQYRMNIARSTVRFIEDELRSAAEALEKADGVRGVPAERRSLDAELARKHYIALKEKLYQAQLTEVLDQRQQGGMVELLDPASLPRERDDTLPILSAGTIVGLLLGLVRKRLRFAVFRKSPPDSEALNLMASPSP